MIDLFTGEPMVVPCTEYQAAWCPVHGDCIGCYVEDEDGIQPDDWLGGCPLHDRLSQHAQGAVEP